MKLARHLGLAAVLAVVAFPASGQLIHRSSKKKAPPPPANDSVAPDKVLYDHAMDQIKHARFDVARLQLNALLNTYPESEYLAKAKLAIADSYFKEGGGGNLDLAVDEYKSFITFFPFLEEAAYAQMQVAMTHYRRMDKPDRDRTEAQLAEEEFQVFLEKYPDSPLAAQSGQHLRDVQEALAEGDFRIASYYTTKKSYKAASSRLADIASRYPLYSKSDQVLWMLGNIWEKAPTQTKEEEQVAAERRILAAQIYTRLVRDYPLSKLVPGAKEKLTKLGAPIPQPDPMALARMQKEQQLPRNRENILTHATGILHSGPDVSSAARVGTPTMTPPDDNSTDADTLRAAATNRMSIVAGGSTGVGGTSTGTASGSAAPAPPSAGNTAAMEMISTDGTVLPVANTAAVPPPTTGTPGTAQPVGTGQPAGSSSSSTPPATSDASPGTTPSQDTQTKLCTDTKSDKSSDGQQANCKEDPKKESSSKKKNPLKKIIPW